MAGDWIKMRVDLADDPAVIAIGEQFGLDTDHVVGKLHRLWSWADKHTVDGNAVGVTYSWLDRYLGVTGFGESLEEVGWLDHDGAVLTIPKFERHNGESSKKRALSAKRVASFKQRTANAKSVTSALPREEKSREEKIEEIPPTPFSLPPILDSQEFRDAFAAWIAYKTERRERPKPQGLKATVSRMANVAGSNGVAAVIAAIQRAMANGWRGWDQESSFGVKNGKQPTTRYSSARYRPTSGTS
jgi:hypothetical protein